MEKGICLVRESLFLLFFCLWCLGEEPCCKACLTVRVSTDVPCSNSFPGLFGKEMLYDQGQICLLYCGSVKKPCYNSATLSF